MSPAQTVSASVDYLDQLYHEPIVPPRTAGLRRIEYLLDSLGNPHRAYRTVHITGTCGKGSTTTMIGHILQDAGYRSGLFRSPHLETYRERIAVDGKMIDEQEWLAAFNRVLPIAEAMRQGTAHGYDLGRISLFEFVWAMGALYFARQGIDIAAIEVGVGGRLSATNVIDPDVAVLTNVSLDHTPFLGHTEADIAWAKSGIIKPGSDAVTAADQADVLDIIRQQCATSHSPLWVVDGEVSYLARSCGLQGQQVAVRTPSREYRQLELVMLGAHQARNAATAVAAIDLLRLRGLAIAPEAVATGLARTRFPGRLEILREEPLVVVDGARNAASAATLRVALDTIFADRQIILVAGVLADKDAAAIAAALGPRSLQAIVAQPPWEERAGDPGRVVSALRPYVPTVERIDDLPTAVERSLEVAGRRHMVLITGSLYLVGAVRHLLVAAESPVSQHDRASTPLGTA